MSGPELQGAEREATTHSGNMAYAVAVEEAAKTETKAGVAVVQKSALEPVAAVFVSVAVQITVRQRRGSTWDLARVLSTVLLEFRRQGKGRWKRKRRESAAVTVQAVSTSWSRR